MTGVLNSEKKKFSIRLAQAIIHCIFIALSLSVILPILLTVIVSFSTEDSVIQNGYSFFPSGWSLDAYRTVFSDNEILQAYWVTIRVTLIGTFCSVFFGAMCAYVISSPRVKYANAIAIFLYLPTVMSAGIVPWSYLIKEVFHLDNTLTVLWLPSLVNVFNIFLMRNYYKRIPYELLESGQIDGAGQFTLFVRIMLPLSLPIIATVTLFQTLGFWNDYTNATWFIDLNHRELYPLQYYLFRLWDKMQNPASGGDVPFETTFIATMFVTMGPIILVYPFVQKYFIKGIVVGGVKG